MKIIISSGHSKIVRGAEGIIDEVDEARKVVDRVAEYLSSAGVGVEVFHDDVSTTQSANLERIVDFHNSETRDLDVSVHFNCYETTQNPMGCEVLYVTQQALAGNVCDAICAASGLKNRGAKKRTDLAFLNNTDGPAILVETCFVDSQKDVDLYRMSFDAICAAIASSISGIDIESETPLPPATTQPPTTAPPSVVPTVTITVNPPGSVKIITL
jgi:N-acetylmuramoyl-L-alanine amidase